MTTQTAPKNPGADLPPLQTNAAGKVANDVVIGWYKLLFGTRQMDERASRYIRRGMGWSYHARCAGHEGIQVALGMSFRPNKDFLFPYYRDLGTNYAAGLTPLELFLNGLSRDADPCSGGRHMSNHFGKPSIGVQNVSSCTGNHALHAVGVARAIKYYKSDGVAMSSQGDSSTSEGYCFEAYSGASREMLPVVFVVQNNGYGISVPVEQQSSSRNVADNYRGIKNLRVIDCDGTDIFDSVRAMKDAHEHARSGKGPVMVHAMCIRMGAHSNSDAHDLYRSAEEILEAQKLDPVLRLRAHLLGAKLIDAAKLKELEDAIERQLDLEAEQAEASPKPSAESVHEFVTPPEANLVKEGLDTALPEGEPTEKLREAINRTLIEEFRHNPNTFAWGQDIASKDKGGVFNLTKGMLAEFGPARVFNGPIAEDFIVGTANGMSRFSKDIRIVIEAAQFADYVWPAMEQIVETTHDYWRSKGQFSPNIVCRLASGGYITGGLYHSQNVEAVMSHLPGVRVIVPAFADDAAGLLRTAIRSQGLTFFLEPKYLYNRPEAKGPKGSDKFAIPLGKGRVRRSGTDLSIITYGNTVHMCLRVAEKLEAEGHSVEVFDLRCIKPLDVEGIKETTRRTGKVLVVHEDHLFQGVGAEIASFIGEHCFQDLDAPVRRIGALDIPIGFSPILEQATLPQDATVEAAVRSLLAF
ncbi:MAG: thiamine pyrophosphate-dependent enzyme [Deltaproteobacteria bacterium]|nr:thiamine pyrophosphate-dependent enzyme [Deltaproteobacteria bacterium]